MGPKFACLLVYLFAFRSGGKQLKLPEVESRPFSELFGMLSLYWLYEADNLGLTKQVHIGVHNAKSTLNTYCTNAKAVVRFHFPQQTYITRTQQQKIRQSLNQAVSLLCFLFPGHVKVKKGKGKRLHLRKVQQQVKLAEVKHAFLLRLYFLNVY